MVTAVVLEEHAIEIVEVLHNTKLNSQDGLNICEMHVSKMWECCKIQGRSRRRVLRLRRCMPPMCGSAAQFEAESQGWSGHLRGACLQSVGVLQKSTAKPKNGLALA